MRPWGDYYRLIIIFVGFMCLVFCCSNYIIINFTFICMKNDMEGAVEVNGTLRSIYDYTPKEKTAIFWAVAIGTIIGTPPVNYLYVKFNAKYPFFVAGVVSTIATVLSPWAASYNFYAFLGMRVLQGIAYSADFAAIGVLINKWAPLKETAMFIAALTSFSAISSIMTNGVSGVMCETTGWRSIFYAHAFFTAVFFSLWMLLYTDDPSEHKAVSKRELSKIQKNKSSAHLEKHVDIPYKKLLTSPVVWAVWASAFTELSSLILLVTYTPIYFRDVLKFSVQETGFVLGVITSFHLPLRFVFAFISDKATFLSEKGKILFFNSLAVGLIGVEFAIFGYIPHEHKYAAAVFLGILECCYAFNSGGFYKCASLHTRQFSHFVISAIQFTKCIALFTSPALVAFWVTDESDQSQWINVFWTLCAINVAANTFSLFYLTDEPAEYTNVDLPTTSEMGGRVAPTHDQNRIAFH